MSWSRGHNLLCCAVGAPASHSSAAHAELTHSKSCSRNRSWWFKKLLTIAVTEITVRTWTTGKQSQQCRAASELGTTVLTSPSWSISVTASLTHLFCGNGIWHFPKMHKYSILPVVRYQTSVSGQLASQMHSEVREQALRGKGHSLAHGSSKAEDCDLISCWSHLQVNSFPGTYQKKKVLDYASWNNTSLNKALTMEIDCLETLWGQEKIKAFLKEWLKIFIAILWWWLFSADMGHSCTCLCEERKTRMKGFFFFILLPFGPISLQNTQKVALQRMHSFESLWLAAWAKVNSS